MFSIGTLFFFTGPVLGRASNLTVNIRISCECEWDHFRHVSNVWYCLLSAQWITLWTKIQISGGDHLFKKILVPRLISAALPITGLLHTNFSLMGTSSNIVYMSVSDVILTWWVSWWCLHTLRMLWTLRSLLHLPLLPRRCWYCCRSLHWSGQSLQHTTCKV